jgi:hypothetical protein
VNSSFPQKSVFKASERIFVFLLLIGLFCDGLACNRTTATQLTPSASKTTKNQPGTTPALASITAAADPTVSARDSSSSLARGTESAPSRLPGPIQFTDATGQSGIHFKYNSGAFGKKLLPETIGPGVCVIDFDNDGWPDVLFVNSMDWPGHKSGKSYPALYRNNHDGTFTDVTRQAGLAVEMYGLGCTVGDYDNDGYDDLYITAVGNSHLFRNLHNGKFADVTGKTGLASPGFATSAAWIDYDNDGKLDLFVAHYVKWSVDADQYCSLTGKQKSYCTPEAYKGESSELFHNRGDGTFENVTKKAGLFDPSSKSLGIALLDYDSDGWIDLFVSNDTQPNKLYRNNHNGTFTDVAVPSGIAFSEAGTSRAGMGTDVGDYDNSGRQAILIGDFANEGMALYRSDGSGLYTDQAPATGLSRMTMKSLTFGTLFFDYDLDGRLDVLAVNGHVADDISQLQPAIKYAEPGQLFRNVGNNKFEDVTARVSQALQQPIVGRGAAYFDYDNDGDLDLLVMDNRGNARLLRNDKGNQNDMIRLKLIGTKSNRDAVGARVSVTSNRGEHQSAMVKTGSSYLSQSEFPLTFGLGKPTAQEKKVAISIVWPSGRKEAFSAVKCNRALIIQEGKGILSEIPLNFVKSDGRG